MPAALVHTHRLPSGLLLEFAEQGRLGGPPVLMLHGITDSWRSFEPVPSTSQAHTWAGAGHAMHWEQPGRFAALLGDFVGTLDRSLEHAPCSTS